MDVHERGSSTVDCFSLIGAFGHSGLIRSIMRRHSVARAVHRFEVEDRLPYRPPSSIRDTTLAVKSTIGTIRA